jgi:hypothetical protein
LFAFAHELPSCAANLAACPVVANPAIIAR